MMRAKFILALSVASAIGCAKYDNGSRGEASREVERISEYPCSCTNNNIYAIVTNEVLSVEDIGKRWVVRTHHYYPEGEWVSIDGGTSTPIRIEVMVGYPLQFIKDGEPTDTSISNKTCFCGGPWEFTTNGLFECERITSRTGMNCCGCDGYIWKTNVFTKAKDEGAYK